MAIVWADVTAIAPELSTVGASTQTAILAYANAELDAATWGGRLERGRAYLAAHLATLSRRAGSGGAVVSESVGDVSRAYSTGDALASDLEATAYGKEFRRLIKTLPLARFGVSNGS